MNRIFESDLWRSFVTGVQVNDGDSGPRLRGLLAFAQPSRRSSINDESGTAGYFDVFPNSSTSDLLSTSPPPYDTSSHQDRVLPPPRFNVIPREEEGRECLPEYSCSIRREAVFARKMEYRSPFERACDRAWFKVFVILDGTMLKVCKVKTMMLAGRSLARDMGVNPDLPIATSAGTILKTYTLQHAEVGNAVDYKKRSYVIRLRVETDQFLLSCNALETFLDWLEALSAAINLAPPLEERSLPRFRTVPRYLTQRSATARRRSASRLETSVSDPVGDTSRRRANSRLQESHVSRNADRNPSDSRLNAPTEEGQLSENLASEEYIEGADPNESRTTISSAPLSRRPSTSSASAERSLSPPPRPGTSPACSQESQLDDGKWRPPNRWTMARDIRYAHRCTTVLRRDTPRRSDLVIKDGKRWKINWTEGRLVLQKEKPPRLPKYDEK